MDMGRDMDRVMDIYPFLCGVHTIQTLRKVQGIWLPNQTGGLGRVGIIMKGGVETIYSG